MQLPGINKPGSIPTITTGSIIISQRFARRAARVASTTTGTVTTLSTSMMKSGGRVLNRTMASTAKTTTTTPSMSTSSSLTSNLPSQVIRELADAMNGTELDTTAAATAVGLDATAPDPTTTSSTWNSTLSTASARSNDSCATIFANYTQPITGIFCNWTWDSLLCWPPTPAGIMASMYCPAGYHGVDTRKFAIRKCELDGNWGKRPNSTEQTAGGWTDYAPCYKPEVVRLMQEIKDVNLYMEIAQRTRTLEIVGLCLSLLALIISLVIFCSFTSLRNNRTRIHKNLFVAMVLQVVVRLTLYLDQFRRGRPDANATVSMIENTPYLCEASYVLLEYARTAMFMWMFIEGLYLHNMITVAVFQGSFPLKLFALLGWGLPVLMTFVWVQCTAIFMDTSVGECMWNYNLTPYYWILEGPRLTVILLNFVFLVNIIRVLVMKLRQSQASEIEQTRKAVRAAIVLLPLLGITNLLHLVPALKTAWKFAVWSYVTHFLTSFQGFFIALIYCFLNGEVRTVLLKSLGVWMSVRGHPEWAPKRTPMYSGAPNTAPDTDVAQQSGESTSSGGRVPRPIKPLKGRKAKGVMICINNEPQQQRIRNTNNNSTNGNGPHTIEDATGSAVATRIRSKESSAGRASWMTNLCNRGKKNKCVMPDAQVSPPIFMTPTSTAALETTTALVAAADVTAENTTEAAIG